MKTKIFIVTNNDGSYTNVILGKDFEFLANAICRDQIDRSNLVCYEIITNDKLLAKYKKDENVKKYIDRFEYHDFLKQYIPEVFVDGNSTKLHKIVHYKYMEFPKEINECIKLGKKISMKRIDKIIHKQMNENLGKREERTFDYLQFINRLNQ